jgi:hypothetical protein
MDELHHLHEKLSQEPMLKFVEDFDGLLIAAIMEDRLGEVIPPLRERFEVIQVSPSPEGTLFETMRACFRADELTQAAVGSSVRVFRVPGRGGRTVDTLFEHAINGLTARQPSSPTGRFGARLEKD